MARVMSRCECGKVKPKTSDKCRRCVDAILKECRAETQRIRAEAQRIVDTGRCPRCGDELERNLALSGWWQCANYGNRRLENGRSDNPNCGFQCFTAPYYSPLPPSP